MKPAPQETRMRARCVGVGRTLFGIVTAGHAAAKFQPNGVVIDPEIAPAASTGAGHVTRMNALQRMLWWITALVSLLAANVAQSQAAPPSGKMLGMYVHQHWAYNHPYAARTWTLDDWRGYLDGIRQLGYNMVLIWPMLETMPDPLTPSDRANIEKIAAVIDIAHRDFGLKVNIVLCPNVSAKNAEAARYTFQERPFFHTDDRVDPADPVEFGKLMAWREKLFRPLAAADGLFVIDSDPGGYPHSTNLDFVYLLGAHRRMLDRLRPGIEVVYWAHFGWESYGRFYATGELFDSAGKVLRGPPQEPREAVVLLARQPRAEPWGVANSGFADDFLEPIGMSGRVLKFPYGAIEAEPSYPFTIYGNAPRVSSGGKQLESAYDAGRNGAARGVLGNSQTHCVQLPNLFAFARGARGLSAEKGDYVVFANDLIPGHGELIVEAWESLQGDTASRMEEAAARLEALNSRALRVGPLRGLLLGSAERFVDDLVKQLHVKSSLHRFRSAVLSRPADQALVTRSLAAFARAVAVWQRTHAYGNYWAWPAMEDALRELDDPELDAVLDSRTFVSKEGATPFERVRRGLAGLEDYSSRLVTAIERAAAKHQTR